MVTMTYEAIQQKHESYATEMKHRPVTETHWGYGGHGSCSSLHSRVQNVLRLSMQNRDIEALVFRKVETKNIQLNSGTIRYDQIR